MFEEDIFQHITKINMPLRKGIATVEFNFRQVTNSSYIPARFRATVLSSSGNILRDSLTGAQGPVRPPPSVPDTKFRNANAVWCYSPYSVLTQTVTPSGSTVIDRGKYIVGTNIGDVSLLVDPILGTVVPFFIDYTGNFTGGGGLIVYGPPNPTLAQLNVWALTAGLTGYTSIWAKLIQITNSHFEAGGDLYFTEDKGATVTFLNIPKIKSRLPKGVDTFTFQVFVTGVGTFESDFSWAITLGTYKKSTTFNFPAPNQFPRDPVTRLLDYGAIPGGQVAGGASSGSVTGAEQIVPPSIVNVTINLKTLATTVTVQPVS